MKSLFKTSLISAALIIIGLATGCGSTRTENGVIIQEAPPSYNPLDYIPGFK
ncbi:MAG: hypothetical protein AAGH40_06130 [Verrucomicrobiota bacterium]